MSFSKMVRAGGVAVATLGLSTCNDNGAVDPAPPPLDCSTAGDGSGLSAYAELNGTTLTITINMNYDAFWKEAPTISEVQGATLQSVSLSSLGSPIIQLELASADTTSGSFKLSGTLRDATDFECLVNRTFTFTITDGAVEVAQNERRLPLHARERAAIVILRREGHDVELHASGATDGATIGWTATGGQVAIDARDRARWRLPHEPGLYQIELLVDRGSEGFVLDTLTLEVT